MSSTPPPRRHAVVAGVAAGLLALSLGGAPALAASPTPSPSTSSGAPKPGKAPAVFGLGPATHGRIDGRAYYNYLASPGASLRDQVGVLNIGTAPLTITVYTSDAIAGSGGDIAYPPAATKATDVGSWLRLDTPGGRTTIVVPGRTTVYIPVTLAVPAGANPGDHTGAVIASIQGLATNAQGQRVTLDQRVATRVFVRVSGALRPSLAIEDLHATYQGSLNPLARGAVTVTYRVHNTGNLKLGGDQTIDVKGWFGGSVRAVAPPQIPLLLPGGTVDETVQVDGVWPQLWLSGTVTVAPRALPADSDPVAGPWSATTHFWAFPWVLIGLLLLLAVATWAWLRRRRPGSGAEADGPPEEPTVERTPEGAVS